MLHIICNIFHVFNIKVSLKLRPKGGRKFRPGRHWENVDIFEKQFSEVLQILSFI